RKLDVHSLAHITGGGFDENLPRALRAGQGVTIEESKIFNLPIFDYLETLGKLKRREMYNVFNMGVGMVLIVAKEDQNEVLDILSKNSEVARVIGVVTNKPGVLIL
ncbi:MAG: AIR synthase-related protein, partial [Bacilli bacterium]|nr:AIR synthase-related protein [Bacilli bacterium]